MIEYLRTENQVLKEKLGKRRIVLSDEQRRRLALKGKVLGRKVLQTVGTPRSGRNCFLEPSPSARRSSLVARRTNFLLDAPFGSPDNPSIP
jgi:hypothetical protein